MSTPIVIGMGGKLRAGKDAVADHLVDAHGFTKFGMSDPLLAHVLIVDPYIPINAAPSDRCPNALEGLFVRASEMVAQVGYVDAKKNDEFRRFMQADGTEGGRDFHHEDIWADKLGRMIDSELQRGNNVVLTGVRFPNEVALIHRFAGKTYWVQRPGLDSAAPSAAHASENSVTAADFDTTIHNDGTLEDLHATVDRLLERTHA